jgi:hypothetical protein
MQRRWRANVAKNSVYGESAVKCQSLFGVAQSFTFLNKKLTSPIGCRRFQLTLKRLANSAQRHLGVTSVLGFMCIGDVMHDVREQYAPAISFVNPAIFPESDIQNAMNFFLCEPNTNHLDRAVGTNCSRRNEKFASIVNASICHSAATTKSPTSFVPHPILPAFWLFIFVPVTV